MSEEITSKSTELELVRHALEISLDIIEATQPDIDDDDILALQFCGRVLAASQDGDMSEVRAEIAEEEDDGDDT